MNALARLYERIGQALPEARGKPGRVSQPPASPPVQDRLTDEPPGDRPLAAWPPLTTEDVERLLPSADASRTRRWLEHLRRRRRRGIRR